MFHHPGPKAAAFHKVQVMKGSGRAILCLIDGQDVWIPKSLLLQSDGNEVWEEGDSGTLSIPEWFALEKGLL